MTNLFGKTEFVTLYDVINNNNNTEFASEAWREVDEFISEFNQACSNSNLEDWLDSSGPFNITARLYRIAALLWVHDDKNIHEVDKSDVMVHMDSLMNYVNTTESNYIK